MQKVIKLKKVFKEKYVRRRGSPKTEFQGHTTDFFIDGVPVKESEWKTRIAALIDENTFKLLTNPAHFANLHWQKRREILLQVCGDVSDKDVIASNKDLAALPEILGNRSLDDHKKVVASKKKEINDRLKEIPARIDELQKGMVDVSGYDAGAINAKIKELETRIQAAKDNAGTAALRKQRAELEAKRAEIQGKLDGLVRAAQRAIDDEIEKMVDDQREKRSGLRAASNEIAILTDTIERNDKQMDYLRRQFTEIAGQEFSGPGNCPTCGQALPEDQVQAAIDKHNQEKAHKLEDINEHGRKLKTMNTVALVERSKFDKSKSALESEIEALETKIQTARNQKPTTLAKVGTIEKKALESLKEEITEIDTRIAENAPVDTKPFEDERAAHQGKLAALDVAKKAVARVEVLGAEEKELAAKYEELERQTFLMEGFIRSKVEMLEGKINSRFSLVRWKLFSEQINGGLSEACEATINGVPFSSANTGSQILAGLDIISTLSKHYGVKAPVFLDHRESLTSEPAVDSQLISLVADPTFKTLEVTYG